MACAAVQGRAEDPERPATSATIPATEPEAGTRATEADPETAGPSSPFKKMRLEELMDVEVTSVSRQESTVGRTPAAVTVITSEMIRRSGATTFPELFRMVPGMNVARIDNNKWWVSSRGFNDRFATKLLVQIDGRALYNPIFSGVYWDTVDYPLEDVDRVEIVRGPGATVWGANAVNGVINIMTKSAKDTQGGLLTLGGGTEELGFGTLRYGGKIGNDLYYRVYGKGFLRDDQFSLEGDPNDGWWGSSGGARFDWDLGGQDSLTLQGDYLHSTAGRRDFRPTVVPPFTFPNFEDEVSDTANVLARWTHKIDKDSSYSVRLYWDHFERYSTNNLLDFRIDTYDVDFQHNFPIGDRHKVVYGLGYRYIDAFLGGSSDDGGFILTFDPDRRHLDLVSAFIQDEIALVPDTLSLTIGSKFEHNDFTGFEVQPTLRLLWTPTKEQAVWAAVSRAIRTPSVRDDSFRFTLLPVSTTPPTYPNVRGNPHLEPEELLALELGYRTQLTKTFSIDAAVFFNAYDNLLATRAGPAEPGPGGSTFLPSVNENGMDAENYGVEVAATWQVSDAWRFYGAYTFLEQQWHRDAGFSASAEAQEGQSPEHQFYLQSSWDLPHNLQLDLIGRYVRALEGFNLSGSGATVNEISDYFALDVRLSWRPDEHFELAIVGQNLLDNHHPEVGSNPLIRGPLVEIERGVYASITYRW